MFLKVPVTWQARKAFLFYSKWGFQTVWKLYQKKLLAKETKWTDKVGLSILSVLILRFSFGPVKFVRLERNRPLVWSRGQGVKLWARCLTPTMLTPLTPPWGIKFYLPTVWEMWQSRGREGGWRVLPTMEQNPIQRGWKYSNLLNPFSWATGIWLLILPSGFHPFSFKFVQRILCLIKKTFEHSHQLFSGKCMDVIGWSNLFITSGRVRVNDVATWIGPNSIVCAVCKQTFALVVCGAAILKSISHQQAW